MKKAKNSQDAEKIQEVYSGKPHCWIQWKATDVRMDIHCKCGYQSQFAGLFAYSVKCPICSTSYVCNPHIELIEVECEPQYVKIGNVNDFD